MKTKYLKEKILSFFDSFMCKNFTWYCRRVSVLINAGNVSEVFCRQNTINSEFEIKIHGNNVYADGQKFVFDRPILFSGINASLNGAEIQFIGNFKTYIFAENRSVIDFRNGKINGRL